MTEENPIFDLLQQHKSAKTRDKAAARRRLERRSVPVRFRDFRQSASSYQPDDDLFTAANMALTVGAPLLLTGEPGTGKTQVAHYLAWYFDIPIFEYTVRSTSTAEDIKYDFDAVRWLRNAHQRERISDPHTGEERDLVREDCLQRRALWQAYACDSQCVLLIDEIDKAPRDFPNDLLQELDKHEFAHPLQQEEKIKAHNPQQPPIVVITSNAERRLPDAFLRRCIYHYIELDEPLLRRAVAARAQDFPHLDREMTDLAIEKFLELRANEHLNKKPATGEILVWLSILSARNIKAQDLRQDKLSELPGIRALIKDKGDLDRL